MILLFDNIGSAIIGATVMMLILVLNLRMVDINMESTSTYMVKNQANDLATWMEEDLLKLGDNIDRTVEVPFINPTDSGDVTTQFTFYRDSINTTVDPQDTIRVGTRYVLNRSGTRILANDTIDVYRITRELQYDGGAWFNSGGSTPMLSFIQIDILNGDAQVLADPVNAATINPDSVQNTRISFSMVTPFETDRTLLRQVYYGSTLLIPN